MERFYAERQGASWCVHDRELLITLGPMRGQHRIVEWCGGQAQVEQIAAGLNATRGHAADEPKCVECRAQLTGGDTPRST